LTPSAAVDASAPLREGIELLAYEGGLGDALGTLASGGIVHLLVEAGPGLFTALWDHGLVDELVLYHSGGVLGAEAPAAYAGSTPSATDVVDRRFAVVETGMAGADAVTVWRPLPDVVAA
jgi:riboflavin biosynthesis pyrimidine reductase